MYRRREQGERSTVNTRGGENQTGSAVLVYMDKGEKSDQEKRY